MADDITPEPDEVRSEPAHNPVARCRASKTDSSPSTAA
ncbi:MAG: hypothetical protein K0R81_2470 [Microbacterium sp.]|nr:hypothetical protein [Microbacterium sp.]